VISFEIISEYNHNNSADDCINWSNRTGDISDEIKKMNLFDVFYKEEFQNDGQLICMEDFKEAFNGNSKDFPSVFDLLEQEDYLFNWQSKNNRFYLTDGNMDEINDLSEGCYIFIKTV
jgi:hypothetical protein